MEKRLSMRKAFPKPVRFEYSRIKNNRLEILMERGNGVDISQGGLGITSHYDLKEKEILKLHIPIEETQITIPVIAEVIWSKPESSHFRVGLKFLA